MQTMVCSRWTTGYAVFRIIPYSRIVYPGIPPFVEGVCVSITRYDILELIKIFIQCRKMKFEKNYENSKSTDETTFFNFGTLFNYILLRKTFRKVILWISLYSCKIKTKTNSALFQLDALRFTQIWNLLCKRFYVKETKCLSVVCINQHKKCWDPQSKTNI